MCHCSSARSLMVRLERTFSSATVCDQEHCYHAEPDLQTLMETSRDPDRLLWAWTGWRNAVGPPMREVYPQLIDVLNSGARHAGFPDMGAVWRYELEMPNIEQTAAGLYEEIKPLYQQLHALVRAQLRSYYGPQLVSADGPIPAHLLGNLWSQSWQSLEDIVSPLSETQRPDLSRKLAQKFSVTDFVKLAENFYVSLGLPPMTEKFWRNSIFQRPDDNRNMTCHASSADFFTDDDFRILMCLERNERDFGVIHHEMGHIQYFMAYRHLPTILRDGANSAFHEAVGDTFFYSIFGPAHLRRLGLIDDDGFSPERSLQLLLQRALAKIPLIGFSLALDRWRWQVYAGRVAPERYNAAWWQLREQLSGVRHPACTAQQMEAGCNADGMDPGAKFHVADNIPHIRYFLAVFLQLQFFEGLCEAKYGSPLPIPLHECDLYGSREAGDRLMAMLSLGKGRSWQDALEVITGSREISAQPLLRYFQPLHDWLEEENRRTGRPVGWGGQ
ncbi:angiotensin-converting enzyme-like isoform X2 [Amphibalanus amphitrite]|uniref:angiotensin-converting enzyme-like isoform X2 n=1 Tax=Amphibalanus amphitrite TaxID=1232801 RepID=UPI001C90357D|nr:angiotensin-converting enzyme-like isoform X2 [Amphibalanus amphitrite]